MQPDSIVSTVTASKEYNDLTGRIDKNETKWKQTADDFTISISQLEGWQNSAETWFEFKTDGLQIGKKENGVMSKFSTKIDNQGIYFRDGSSNVAWINNQTMHIGEAEIEQTIKMGPLTGIVDSTGINWVWNT